jgi:hypothetical protein
MNFKNWSASALFLLAIFWNGCGGGTRTGNPPSESRVNVELASITSSSVTSLELCPRTLRFIQSESGASVDLTLTPTESVVGASSASLGTLTVPNLNYDKIVLGVTSECSNSRSMRLINSQGTIVSTSSASIQYSGTFSIDSNVTTVKLYSQNIIDQLGSVNSAATLESTVTSVDGRVLTTSGTNTLSYREAVLADAPITYWMLDQPAGTASGYKAIIDSSGANYCSGKPCPLRLPNDLAYPTLGVSSLNEARMGLAVYFDGDNTVIGEDHLGYWDTPPYFYFSDGAGTDQPFTFETWIYLDSGFSAAGAIASSYHDNNSRSYILGVTASRQLYFRLFNQDSDNKRIGRRYATSLTPATWYHVVMTYDGSKLESGIQLYVNGVRVDDTSDSAGTYTGVRTDLPFLLGNTHSTHATFHGKLDEFAIYSSVLAPTRILGHYQAATQ